MAKRTEKSKFFLATVFFWIGRPIYYLLAISITLIPLSFAFISTLPLQLIKLTHSLSKKLSLLFALQSKKIAKNISKLKRQTIRKLRVSFKQISFPKLTLPRPKLPRITPSYITLKLPKLTLPTPTTKQIFFLLSSTLALTSFYWIILKDLPNPNNLITRNQIVTTKIYDRNKRLLFKIYKNENRSIINLNNIPPHVKLATIAIEDANFYQHTGFSIRGILRALKKNVTEKKLQGGSTITQQLVKNALLSPEKTLTRKIKEAILALQVELKFSKDEILEMYFNEVGYGGAAYGIEEASQLYFNKSINQVDLSEAALLAGLPAAPTTYSPFGTNPELSISRQHEVLRRMVEENFITHEQADFAKTQKLSFAPQQTNIKAPHFVMYVKDLLVKKYGEALVHQGGLEVITSLDLDLQTLTETAVTKELEQLHRLHVTNGASIVTNPQTGEILAMVGSNNYFDSTNDGQVNVTLRPRQPGSSIKPINYAVALSNGFTPATIIPDSPICYRLPGQKPYCPKNYDNRFHGNVTLRQALASSYNVPAVKTLSHFGVSNMINLGQAMGITTWNDPSRFGLSLTLGGGDVKMVDMAVVYGSIANQGLKTPLNPILQINDYRNKALHQFRCQTNTNLIDTAQAKTHTCQSDRVLDPNVAYQLTDILSDNLARAQAFGTHSVLNITNHQVAVKTGTTNNLRDNWTIGFTTDYLVATWVGNNDNSPMSYVASGITGASPIWNTIMSSLLANQPPHAFIPPENLKKVAICTLTGTRICSACPNTREEYFVPGTEPQSFCSNETIEQLLTKKQEEKDKQDQILQGLSTSN